MKERKWLSTELPEDNVNIFREFLHEKEIRFETSAAADYIHFECYVNTNEQKLCDEFLDTL